MKPRLHQHYKGGLYVVVATAEDSSNHDTRLGAFVVYHSLERCVYHIRPYAEFWEEIEWPDGVRRPRFRPLFHVKEIAC